MQIANRIIMAGPVIRVSLQLPHLTFDLKATETVRGPYSENPEQRI
ncbi:hypothetical protein [Marinobacterium aestuariivivens]|uniref:Uncharacterized protein n=1 Tax=Marinobacterium aestuariivivens TaxID=1698799 RepID=A0ABW2A3J7_9GAMM